MPNQKERKVLKLTKKQLAKLNENIPELINGLSELKAAIAQDTRGVTRQLEATKNALDSLSELGKTQLLRLQMALDRVSKMQSTLSNLLKKISDTSSEITRNLK